MYEEQFGHTVIEEVVEKEGIEFTLTRASPPAISTFEQALEEIKSMYEAQFGHLVLRKLLRRTALSSVSFVDYLHCFLGAGMLPLALICYLCFLMWRQAPIL